MHNTIEEALAQYISHYEATGERRQAAELIEGDAEMVTELGGRIDKFHQLDQALHFQDEPKPTPIPDLPPPLRDPILIGSGGSGHVYKAFDPQLHRFVAVKFLNRQAALDWEKIEREAQFLAALEDETIVTVHSIDPVRQCMVTQLVDGFELLEVAEGLQVSQIMAIMRQVAQALEKAHRHGICHRDIKPANIKLDHQFKPKVLDFGLAQWHGETNHGWGSPGYAAPEQYGSGNLLDHRADVFSLGAVFYRLVCGEAPLNTTTFSENAPPKPIILPKVHQPEIPIDVQTILMKCLEWQPEDRYANMQALINDLDRLERGESVLAKPKNISACLGDKVSDIQRDVSQWQQLGLIYDHEAKRLASELAKLNQSEDDWVIPSRQIHLDQVLLFLGVMVLIFGGLALFYARHFLFEPPGGHYPFLVLASCAGILNWQARRAPKMAAMAYHLAFLGILPLVLLSLFHWVGFLDQPGPETLRLFPSGVFTNRQMQLALPIACLFACWRTSQTKMMGIASSAILLGSASYLAWLLPFGLRPWLEEGVYHQLGFALLPWCLMLGMIGVAFEKRDAGYWASPAYATSLLLAVVIPELIAQNGKTMALLGLSAITPSQVSGDYDPILLDTLWAMTLNGLGLYLLARWLCRRGMTRLQIQAKRLGQLTPFLLLEPLAILVSTGYYATTYHWFYLFAGLLILGLSTITQHKGFYYAGLSNTLIALYFITDHYQWLEAPFWPRTLILIGLTAILVGHWLLKDPRRS